MSRKLETPKDAEAFYEHFTEMLTRCLETGKPSTIAIKTKTRTIEIKIDEVKHGQ